MVFHFSLDKALGLDGFPIRFYQTIWELVGSQASKMVISFLTKDHLLRQFNQTLIYLIPKGNQQETYNDFCPISLCNVTYKFIIRILVSKVQEILEDVISPL